MGPAADDERLMLPGVLEAEGLATYLLTPPFPHNQSLAGFLHLLDLGREVAVLREARSALGADVESALESRARLSEISSALEGLNHSRTRVPRWTSVLTGISEALPPHTHLSQARMAVDNLFLELQGPDAASALEALGGMPGLRGFRASAPVR